MARQEIGRLNEAASRDPELRATLEQAKTLDELVAAARAAGYLFTVEEWREEALARQKELTEAELDCVAGGHIGGVTVALGDGSVRLLLPSVQHKPLMGL